METRNVIAGEGLGHSCAENRIPWRIKGTGQFQTTINNDKAQSDRTPCAKKLKTSHGAKYVFKSEIETIRK